MSRNFADDEAPKDVFGIVPLAKRVGNWIEKTDAGMELDILSAVLSVVTVITYMVSVAAASHHGSEWSLSSCNRHGTCFWLL